MFPPCEEEECRGDGRRGIEENMGDTVYSFNSERYTLQYFYKTFVDEVVSIITSCINTILNTYKEEEGTCSRVCSWSLYFKFTGNKSSFKRSGCQQKIPSCKVQKQNWSILWSVVPEKQLLRLLDDVRVVSDIDVLQRGLVGQLGKIPDSNCRI